ncbi:hypothetical protein C2857_003625 [Epichloe festucae Fl1]|uniref:Uncharacterized protein n=1 Tax=Epichloe festucae (strain Fl1) TaxID=877507 RepID=A0A7S9KNW3_EPIFF|nr:hypothetical protein C2857_003625 [Epichloe festucae Fl1]
MDAARLRILKKKKIKLRDKSGISVIISFIKALKKTGFGKTGYRDIVSRIFDVMQMENEEKVEDMMVLIQSLNRRILCSMLIVLWYMSKPTSIMYSMQSTEKRL